MERVAQIQELLLRSRRLPWLIIGMAVLVLGGTILAGRQQLREKMRAQLIERDGQILYAVALSDLHELEDDPAGDVFGGVDSPENLITVLLKTTRLKGVLAARLFDAEGAFIEAFPVDATQARLSSSDLQRLRNRRPVSHFHPRTRLSDLFVTAAAKEAESNLDTVPVLEVTVPLHGRGKDRLLGVGQFVIEGESLAAQFAQLDRNLTLQALAAFGVSGGLLVGSLFWAFGRLRHSHRLLEERTANLLEANQQLALAAKTSAMGAVTSHLVHGLKSPLSGLQSFVKSLDPARSGMAAEDWEQATAITRRMQTLINQVLSVLREEQGFRQYELTLGDLNAIIGGRMEPLARQKGVTFTSRFEAAETALPNRAANLVTLILMNLVQNGIEATSAGGTVKLLARRDRDCLVFEVHDEGGGVPEAIQSNLFSPCHSTKEQGSGIGLAISKQLANHLGATLELKRSSPDGCIFQLSVPAAALPSEDYK